MNIIELFGLDIKELQAFLFRWGIDVEINYLQAFTDIIIFIISLILLYKYIRSILLYIWKLFPWSSKNRQSKYIHDNLDHDFKEYLGKDNRKQYIETQFLSCPPHDFDEPNKATTATTREPMENFCSRIFKADNPNERVYMVLAGSGMGKTTFMVNIFCYYVRKNMSRKGMSLDIRLLRLDDEHVLDNIKKLSEKPSVNPDKTILLLDALDENRKASENFMEFKNSLEEVMEPFRMVMITCRDQFFDNEMAIPTSTNWVAITRDKNLIKYNKIYISPFSDEDIKRYLSKKYKNKKKRKQAIYIADKCKVLMARPLLLSYMDDLLDSNADFKTLFEIYSQLIDRWLQREVNKISIPTEREKQKEQLYKFSAEIATTIYSNWQATKSMQLSPAQMDLFMKRYNYSNVPYEFKRRSLINRNVVGYFKFAHKSFLEFFLAREYFRNSTFELNFEGMDMARTFYEEQCKKEFSFMENKNYLRLECTHRKKDDDEYKLELLVCKGLDFNHICDALKAMCKNVLTVSFFWNDYSHKLHCFLARMKVPNLQILNYNVSDDKNLLKVFELDKLNCLVFNGALVQEFPQKFIILANKKKLITILNGSFVTWFDKDTNTIPSEMLVNYSIYRRKIILQHFDMNNFSQIMNKYKGEENDGKTSI